jgi:hypothetical protein
MKKQRAWLNTVGNIGRPAPSGLPQRSQYFSILWQERLLGNKKTERKPYGYYSLFNSLSLLPHPKNNKFSYYKNKYQDAIMTRLGGDPNAINQYSRHRNDKIRI